MSVKIMQLLAASLRNQATLPAGSCLFLDRKLIKKKKCVLCVGLEASLTLSDLEQAQDNFKLQVPFSLVPFCFVTPYVKGRRPSLCHVVWSVAPAQRLSELEALLSCSTDSPVSSRPYHACCL